MRALVKVAAQRGVQLFADYPEPVVGDSDVLIKVMAVSVCGTDREMFEWTPAAEAFSPEFPVVLGHEFAGVVMEVGARVTSVKAGDRVAAETHIPCEHCFLCRNGNAHNCMYMKVVGMHVNGGFAERVAMPENVIFKLPDEVSLEVGALLEPAGVAWHAVQRANKGVAGATVLISGCGPVGLFLMQFAAFLGAAEIIAVEPNPYRRRLAEQLGAFVLNPTEDVAAYVRGHFPARDGVDFGFEVSGAPGSLEMLFESVRREGTVITIGHPSAAVPVDVAKFINKKGITLRGVFGRRIWDTWQDLSQLLATGRVDLSWMISHRLSLGELEPIIELLRGDANKIVLLPQVAPAFDPA